MDRNPLQTAFRRTRREQRLGSGKRVCLLCGYSVPEGLVPVTKKFLEDHHVVARRRDDELMVLICRNCHALAGEDLLQEGIDMQPEQNPIALVASMLDALAVFLEDLVAAIRRWAQVLRRSIEGEAKNE